MANDLLMPNALDMYNRGNAIGQQNRFNKLAGHAYAAPEADRNALLTQAVSIDPGAGLKLQDTLQDRDDGSLRRAVGAARYVKQAIDSNNPSMVQGAYQAVRPFLAKIGAAQGKVPPEQWSDEMLPQLHQLLAMGEGATNKGGVPTGFREFDMTAQAAGLQPGTREYQEAAQTALGVRGRAATGGFGFKEIMGADGRTRWARQNPRTGEMEVYDETTGDFAPLGGSGSLNPGAAPAQTPQPAPAGGSSSASNLSSPISMPSGDYQDTFASIAASNGSAVTSGVRPVLPGVGAGANSQHPNGTAADFRTIGLSDAQVQELMNDLRAQGFEVIDERDNRSGRGPHIHAELPPGARAPAARTGLGVSRSPEEQAALTTAAQEQAKINAELGAYDRMTGLEAERAGAVEGAKANAKAGAERVDAQRTKSDALRVYEAGIKGLTSGLSSTNTGPLVGRLPAVTSGQQIAEGGVAAMAPILKQIFRTAGEGTFTDADQKLLLAMVPTRTDTETARAAKLANIDTIVRAKLGGGATTTPSQGGGSNVDDLLGKYGVR